MKESLYLRNIPPNTHTFDIQRFSSQFWISFFCRSISNLTSQTYQMVCKYCISNEFGFADSHHVIQIDPTIFWRPFPFTAQKRLKETYICLLSYWKQEASRNSKMPTSRQFRYPLLVSCKSVVISFKYDVHVQRCALILFHEFAPLGVACSLLINDVGINSLGPGANTRWHWPGPNEQYLHGGSTYPW